MSLIIQHINLNDTEQQDAYFHLLNSYILDEMGGHEPLSNHQKGSFIEMFKAQPNTQALLAKINDQYVGMATYFINFSTFAGKKYINLHDIFVLHRYRKKGIGKLILNKIIDIADKNDFCKVTLEVREDNTKAQSLYFKEGFQFVKPVNMLFMEKKVN
ncbi:MAG: GNAT family N-acetyltransferase [Bacteroidota bacterium]